MRRPDRTAPWPICIGSPFRVRAGPSFYIFAFDHRSQFAELAHRAGRPAAAFRCSRNCCVEAVASVEREAGHYAGKAAAFWRTRLYGQDALNAATGRGWWIGRPVELPRLQSAAVWNTAAPLAPI